MPETETRMSRYHGKDKHRREYEDYVKGGASQESKQADWPSLEDQDQDLGQTQVYSSKNWQEDPYAYHEVEEIPDELSSYYQDYSAYEDSSYGSEAYYDDDHQAYVAYDEYDEGYDQYEEEPAPAPSKPPKVKGPYSLRLDRFLNNALILVAVLLLIVMVIMFVF
ncbi:hypothetical protein [Abiotrophia defectiva]|uniref:Uncharacterized protein n=1 Tax=Abiotrophia defectiva ATCC 49176 TaxID=592010 RepID=W1Q239_ABIDE|nr:hypothetical protein [Abiotrophia defectiva]ESK65107.1 hypothetical protein GCWU000182_01268 [Abiotrophia defectiva ATCC 49176]QKH47507.1 hypothetical protein FOC79_07845 [Abiotrophia defectiva]